MLVLSAFREEKNSTSSSVTARISALETKFVSGFGSLDALDKRLDGFSSRISTLETKFVFSRFESLDTFGNRLDACSSRIQSFEKAISDFDNMASAVDKLITTVNGIDNRLDGFFLKNWYIGDQVCFRFWILGCFWQQLVAFSSRIQSLEKAIFDNMTSDVNKLATTVNGIAASQASLAEKITVVEGHCDALKTKLVSDFESLNAFDNRLDAFSSRIETVEKASSNFDNMIFAVDKLITIIEGIDNRLDVFSSRIGTMETKLVSDFGSLDAFSHRLDAFSSRIQNFEKTISNFDNIASAVDKLVTTDNGIAASQASLAERISVFGGPMWCIRRFCDRQCFAFQYITIFYS